LNTRKIFLCRVVPITLLTLSIDSGTEIKGIIYNNTSQILAFADDIVLVWRTTGVLKEAIINLSKAAKELGLIINLQKTKYTEVTKRPTNSKMLKVDGREFERVREFK
jgi:hypothetical protein